MNALLILLLENVLDGCLVSPRVTQLQVAIPYRQKIFIGIENLLDLNSAYYYFLEISQ